MATFQSRALSGFGSVPSVPSVPSVRRPTFRSQSLAGLDGSAPEVPEAPEEPSFVSKALDFGKAAVNIGSAGVGGILAGQDDASRMFRGLVEKLPEPIRNVIPDPQAPFREAWERSAKENLAGRDPNKPLGFAESIALAPGGGRVLAEAIAPGTPTSAGGRIAKNIGGLVGDIATDPLTYVTGGLGAAAQAAKAGKIGTAGLRALASAPAGLVYAPELIGGVRESGGEALSKIGQGDFAGAVEPGIQAALLSGLGALMATGAVKDAGDLMRRFGKATPNAQAQSRLAQAVERQPTGEPASLDDFLSQLRDEPLNLVDAPENQLLDVWPGETPRGFESPTAPVPDRPVDILAEREFLRSDPEAAAMAEQARLGRQFREETFISPEADAFGKSVRGAITTPDSPRLAEPGFRLSPDARTVAEGRRLPRWEVPREAPPPITALSPFVRPDGPVEAPAGILGDPSDPFVDPPVWNPRYPDVLPDRTVGRTRVLSETPENYPTREPSLLLPDGQRAMPTIHGPLIDDTQPFRRDPGLEARQAEAMGANPEAAQAFVESAEGAAEAAARRMARKRGGNEPVTKLPEDDLSEPFASTPQGMERGLTSPPAPAGDPRLQNPNSMLGRVTRAEAAFRVGDQSLPPTGTDGPVREQSRTPHGQTEPRYAYRARDVGETGVPAVSHAQASLSEADVRRVAPSRTENPQEVVRVDLSKLDPADYEVIPRGEGEAPWVRFKREMPEQSVERVGDVDNADIAAASKAEPPVVRAVASADTADLAQVSGLTVKQAAKGAADVAADGTREFSPEAVAIKRAVLRGEDLSPVRESSRAFHGSPHDFDKFELSDKTIGTGEGAQAYGHGLYFAGNKEVAEHYRETLSRKNVPYIDTKAVQMAKDAYSETKSAGLTGQDAIRETKNKLNDLAQKEQNPYLRQPLYDAANNLESVIEEIGGRRGKTYEVDLKPDEADYLLWDKPLSEQSEKVKAALQPLVDRVAARPNKNGPVDRVRDAVAAGTATADQLYSQLSYVLSNKRGAFPEIRTADQQAASAALREAGIPGIKFLDGSSRGKGEGNHNYVIFNDADVDVVAKYKNRGAASQMDPNARWEAGEKNARPLVGRWNLANPHESLAPIVPTVAKASERLMAPLGRVVEAAARMAGESVNLKGLTLDSNIQAAVRGKDMRVGIMSAVEQATRKYESRLSSGQYDGLSPKQRATMFNREVARHIVNPVSHEIAHAKADRMAKADKRVAKGLDAGGHGPAYVEALRDVYRRMSKGRDMLRRHIEQALDADGGKLRDSLQQAWTEVQPVWGRLDAERAGGRGVSTGDGGSVPVRPGSGSSEAPSGPGGVRGGRVGPERGVRESPRGSGEAGDMAPGSGVRSGRAQVETPEFKRWFGGSKVVDESGPKVVYHGTRETFDSFAKTNDLGFHVGTRDQAQFRLGGNQGDQVKPVFVSVKNPLRLPDHAWSTPARLRPILDSAGIKADGMREAITRAQVAQEALDALEHSDLGLEAYRAEKAALGKEKRDAVRSAFVSGREAIEAAGYDGVVYRNEVEGEGDSYIAFRPEQIKSAIGNKGTFDPTNPDVRESSRAPIKPIPDKGNVTAHPEAPKPFTDKPAGFWDKVREFWKAGLVSAPGTQVANVVSAVGETGVRSVEAGLAGLVDRVMGGPRTRFSGEAVEQIKGSLSRAPAAFKAVADGLRTVASSEGAIGGKTGGIVRTPLQMLGVMDSGTAAMAEGAALRGRALRQAKSELPKGSRDQVAKRMHEIMADPSDALKADVDAEVRNRQYRDAADDPESIVSSIKTLREKHKWLHAVLPFLETPGAIAKLTIERSPVGFKKGFEAYAKYKRAIKAGVPQADLLRFKGEAVDALAKPLTGTLALAMFGLYAKSGGMTGSGPTDPREKALLRETGWQPYSFKVGIGKDSYYVPYGRFEPLSSFLGFAADMAEAKDTKTAGETFEKGLGSIVSNLTSKTYLQGLGDAAEFINDPKRFAGQYLANTAASAVPNIVKKAAQAIDPIQRDTKPSTPGWAGIPERIGKQIASGIPFASKTLPERRAVTGETVERPGNAVSRLLSPVQGTKARTDRDLEGLMAELRVSQGAPSRTVQIPKTKAKVQLSQSEYKYLQDVDKKASDYLRRQVKDTRFKRLDPEQQRAYIQRVYRKAGDEARNRILQRSEFKTRARKAVQESRASA